MGWSYDSSLQTKKDVVRFLLQDTVSTRPLLQDEEIIWLLKQEANVYMAAAVSAEMLATRYKGVSSKSVGGLSISYGGISQQWSDVALKLRARGGCYAVPSAGGISRSDRDAIWDDTDLIRPAFFDEMQQDSDTLPAARGADYNNEEELP